jgi:hypothetical protein
MAVQDMDRREKLLKAARNQFTEKEERGSLYHRRYQGNREEDAGVSWNNYFFFKVRFFVAAGLFGCIMLCQAFQLKIGGYTMEDLKKMLSKNESVESVQTYIENFSVDKIAEVFSNLTEGRKEE